MTTSTDPMGEPAIVTTAGGGITIQAGQMVVLSDLSVNLRQHVVVVAESNLRLCLMRHATRLGQQYAWLVPLGVLLTVVTALVTSTFKDLWKVKGDQIQAFFAMGAVVSLIWLIRKLPAAFHRTDLDALVTAIKSGSDSATVTQRATTPEISGVMTSKTA